MLLHELLNIRYPIIQGAMANIATPQFAASVSNAGGLGIIATGAMNPEETRTAIRVCKTLTDKPFGVNVMMMNPYTKEIFDVIIEEKVTMVTTGAGNPAPYVEALKQAGILVFPVVPSVGLARRLEQSGVDALIVEGTESGGHVGELTTMALVPQVVDAVSIPVIAAGGIASGRQFNAALSLGAIGVQIGTCLLVAKECPIHENYKQTVLKAKDTDTVVTGRSAGVPVRIYKNQMAQEYIGLERQLASKEELERLTLGALRKAVFDGDMKRGSVMMGQVAGMCKSERTLAEILSSIMAEAKEELASLQEKHACL